MIVRLLDAIVCIALAAEIHQNDAAVIATAKRVLKLGVERRFREMIFRVLNNKSPYLYVVWYIATLPDAILKIEPAPKPAPHVLLAQEKARYAEATV